MATWRTIFRSGGRTRPRARTGIRGGPGKIMVAFRRCICVGIEPGKAPGRRMGKLADRSPLCRNRNQDLGGLQPEAGMGGGQESPGSVRDNSLLLNLGRVLKSRSFGNGSEDRKPAPAAGATGRMRPACRALAAPPSRHILYSFVGNGLRNVDRLIALGFSGNALPLRCEGLAQWRDAHATRGRDHGH